MVQIIKTMQPKHLETLSPLLKDFATSACSLPLPILPKHLATFPTTWPFPRGDLYHWIPLLNRFDDILLRFCTVYGLGDGPQIMDFGRHILDSREEPEYATSHRRLDLDALGFAEDGDRQLIEAILSFSTMLLENCGNRSIYASSAHLDSLLNTTSLPLLEKTLLLGSHLAQRYHAAMRRIGPSRNISSALLANHYSLGLGKVTKLALPFSKTVTTPSEAAQPSIPVTSKGKEKPAFSLPTTYKSSSTTVFANDLVSLVKGGSGVDGLSKGARNGVLSSSSTHSDTNWEEWGDVKVAYYPKHATPTEPTSNALHPSNSPAAVAPVTPSPIRRPSNLVPHARSSRLSNSDDSPSMPRSSTHPTGSAGPSDEPQQPIFKTIEVPYSKLKSVGIHALIRDLRRDLPKELQYELLAKLRTADALTTSLETRRQMLVIRLLAITNLAYIYPDSTLQENLLKQDGDEPRRFQLVFQLAELIHPPAEHEASVPVHIQTIAFSSLEALIQHQSKLSDICLALNVNVNHGILLYVVRKAVAEMTEDDGDRSSEQDQWRDALFSLLSNVASHPKHAIDLLAAGLLPILVEILNSRASIAERYHSKVLSFLDSLFINPRETFPPFVAADGLDAISNLLIFDVQSASERVEAGEGVRPEYRSSTVDYDIPFFKQQGLKWVMKFIHRLLSSATNFGGNSDRLLRNLIDSSQLLSSLQQIIGNSHRFGSMIWTNAVNILCDFINNEPTSFAVIAEAGLSRGLLETVTGTTIISPDRNKKPHVPRNTGSSSDPPSDDEDDDDEDDEDSTDEEIDDRPHPPTLTTLQKPRGPLARGIMPTSDTIQIVPLAFGAICLNHAGMKMVQSSRAMESFFEIFESPEHVKCMEGNKDLPVTLGSTFDELIRHHPPLKNTIINAILDMVARVVHLCKTMAEGDRVGAKLWTTDSSGKAIGQTLASEPSAKGKGKAADEGDDIEMTDFVSQALLHKDKPNLSSSTSIAPYINAVASFLLSIVANSTVRSELSSRGGIEYVLDLVELSSLPQDLTKIPFRPRDHESLPHVVSSLADQKPHLLIPSLLKRAQSAADILTPFTSYSGYEPYFAPFVSLEAESESDPELLVNGTKFAQALAKVHTLVSTLQYCFQPSHYSSHRSSSTNFTQVNFCDYYVRLVHSLGSLLGATLKEERVLENMVPGHWSNATRISDYGFTEPGFETTPVLPTYETPDQVTSDQLSEDGIQVPLPSASASADRRPKSPTKSDRDSAQFKNFQTLSHLLFQIPGTITPFFQVLGRALVVKRIPDPYHKQSLGFVAEALAQTILDQLARETESTAKNYAYWIRLLRVIDTMVTDPSSRHKDTPYDTVTIVLQAFQNHSGLDHIKKILDIFTSEIRLSELSAEECEAARAANGEWSKCELATVGVKNILDFYARIVHGKGVAESPQAQTMGTRGDRALGKPEYFSPSQFLVELRVAILPVVRSLWNSDMIEKAPCQVSEKIIAVISAIAKADGEQGAFKRSDKIGPITKAVRKTFSLSSEGFTYLMDQGYDRDLAEESLVRCLNSQQLALEYCREQKAERCGGRNPVPEGDIQPIQPPVGDDATSTPSRPPTTTSTGSATPDEHVLQGSSAPRDFTVPDILAQPSGESTVDGLSSSSSGSTSSPQVQGTTSSTPVVKLRHVTIDDLNEERARLRENLIDRCLDVINAHGEVTFEISDLIKTVVSKSPDPTAMRKMVGETLVIALTSFAGEEDIRTSGKKLVAYAHLLALILTDKLFYTATINELKDNLSTILSFIKLSPGSGSEEASPWIAQILLIVEILLSEDTRPRKAKWNAPKDENDPIQAPILEALEFAVSDEERGQLLNSILEILPRIGKDDSLALSVLRILVILTRSRSVAQTMGEKKNIQRLFVMTKQLAGASSPHIHGPLMLILRHIVEDEETVKQIMRSEIKSLFERHLHQPRHIDTQFYLRGLSHVALRAPELFITITNEMAKFNRWTFNTPDAPGRPPYILLKDPVGTGSDVSANDSDDTVQPTVQATEDLSIQDVKTSTEGMDTEMPDASKTVPPEHKLPVVENPDGVIHFLLCELLNYKDVEDKDPTTLPGASDREVSEGNGDVSMSGTSPDLDNTVQKDSKASKTSSKQEFKSEDHPIYIYRCFILQCLTELLSSYNRTKIEFINFKRSAPQQAMTPSKPRSSVVNYLLFDLIPVGTLDHAETLALRKKIQTSQWADSVLTALLSKTGEQLLDKARDPNDYEDEPDLLFVRRFVLENILKAYKEASSSTEPLDIKYARMLGLADLMSHVMGGKDNPNAPDHPNMISISTSQLSRLMFEKGYITALTASVADIDLNFPGAKRAVKYILKPLKALTATAVRLSELALVSTAPGQAEEDIESATSVSDVEEDREETPDLFRNSTLGMFEHHDDETSDDEEDGDEDMFIGGFEDGNDDDGMEYDEEDDEDNISEEDEEMGQVEGLSGDHGVDIEVTMEEEDGSSGDDEDDEEEDSDDEEDDDARVEIIDEAGNIQEIAADDELGEWESEEDGEEEEDYEGQGADEEEAHAHAMDDMAGGPLGQLVRVLGNEPGAVEMLQAMEDDALEHGQGEDHIVEYEMDDAEDDDDGDEDDDDDEMLFAQHHMHGDGSAIPFGWEGDPDPPVIIRRGHRHHHGPPQFGAIFNNFSGGGHDPLGGMFPLTIEQSRDNLLANLEALDAFIDHLQGGSRTNSRTVQGFGSPFRSLRPGATPSQPSPDEGSNPLLRRNISNVANRDRPRSVGAILQAMTHSLTADLDMGPGAFDIMDIVRAGGGTLSRNGGVHLHISTQPGQRLPSSFRELLGIPPFRERRDNGEPGTTTFFSPKNTSARWKDEAMMLFGANNLEKAMELNNAVLAALAPPAIEADKVLKAAEAERVRKSEEEAAKRLKEELLAKEAQEAEEKAAKERKEAEEREAAERATAEALASLDAEIESEEHTNEPISAEAMDGVETEVPENTAEITGEAAPAEDRPRVMTVIRGNPYDITDLGIDATFLDELPEDLREEVIMSAVAERRSQAAATGAQPSDIDQEFLDALPDDIRDEIIQQERQDRRRREREEQRRVLSANGGGAAAPDMDAASILASFPPALRDTVLMEQDEDMLALLPPEFAAQARAMQRDRPVHQGRIPSRVARRIGISAGEGADTAISQRQARQPVVQMVDKSGVATLLRLMFVLQQGTFRSTLNSVLQNISLNRNNRAEVLSTLLSILQDGSTDMTAVERSFAHLSLRAKQPKDKDPKSPQPAKKALTGLGSLTTLGPLTQANSEVSPLMVVQQCLSSLVYLAGSNPHVPSFFLTEHENVGGLKRSASRKGKGKEIKASKYALNSLLGLLDRNLVMESSAVMESLSSLLNMITQPLQALERRQKEAAEEAKKADTPSDPVPVTTEAITSNEQPQAHLTESAQPTLSALDANLNPTAENVEVAESSTAAEAQSSKPEEPKEAQKKQRLFSPPVIPEYNLKLVINIFVARDCSSRTFRETISTIKNLSIIPDAKAVFGRELITKAQALGEVILKDLEELLPQIQRATSGTEIQGVALAKFFPGGSNQSKLLKVLTALDHLFDPKNEKKDKPSDADAENESSQLVAKQDLISTLYENSTFGPMWEKLSACLSAIRQREHMLNVATILLPLIESLMVVCKNTTLKEAPLARASKEMLLTSPPPDSRMESLFFTFTEEHRKILNDLVRHSPKLMSGTFSLLVKNPKVLEFDNKRNYFSRSIHNRNQTTRQSYPPLQLSVRRDQVFHDSFKSLYYQTGDQMKFGKLSIRFQGEEGVDAGGVTREWFQVLSRQMFDPGYALFIPVSSDRTTFHPNQLSSVNEEHLTFFKFIGRIIGKALYEGRVLDCHFSRAVYKRILGKAVSVKDMESLDPDYYKSLVWMLENDITDIITETFSVDNDKFGVVETIDFKPNGRNIVVTEENKHEYVRLMVEWKLTGSVKEQLDEFLKGFHEIIPAELVAIFNEQELELLISGLPEIDVDDWKSNTEYHNYSASSPQIQWFWRAVRSYDKEERAKLLQFVTGTSKVPLNGFRELEGMNGFSRFNIHRDYGNKERLPSSHTCFNQLDLPEYESYDALRQHVLTAITAGSEYFGFA
ncbi:hypothetical protein B7494_g3474 [Chlorociboria aeruginascens]|nr:hypothetical protein B7494_g3474 [Chlorociboria aeruginascens]